MDQHGKKEVIEEGQFKEGLIVEVREGNISEVVCREYYKENGELQVEEGEMYKVDIIAAMQKETPEEQIQELAEQLGTEDFYVSQSVVDILKA